VLDSLEAPLRHITAPTAQVLAEQGEQRVASLVSLTPADAKEVDLELSE